ncbi:hypothetical protein PFISCL1PPCAC_16675, partial [Pristionchus fissidentatus]
TYSVTSGLWRAVLALLDIVQLASLPPTYRNPHLSSRSLRAPAIASSLGNRGMKSVVIEEEELEMDEESGLRQMEQHTLNQLNSLLKPDRRAPKRPMPCGLGHSPHADSSGGMDGVEFNMRLIREVRDRPFLYDVMAEAYNNPTWRVSAWNDVAIGLDCTPDQVKTRWKTLRDKFKKEDKKVRNGDSSSWPYYDAMEFIQPHLRDKSYMMQHPHQLQQQQSQQSHHHEMFASPTRAASAASSKWRMEEQAMMKDMEEGPTAEKKPMLDDVTRSGVPPGSIIVETDDGSSTAGVEEREEGREESGGGGGEYGREMLLMSRLGNRHYSSAVSHHHASPPPPAHNHQTGVWNQQDEDEVFGHMIALKLSKMEPRFKEAVKVKLMQTLYDAQFGPESPQSTMGQQ